MMARRRMTTGAQPVNRHDAGVLQAAGDLGFDQKPLVADRLVGVVVEDLVERGLAVRLRIQGCDRRLH